MPEKRSVSTQRIVLAVALIAVIGSVFWVGKRILEPVQISLLVPGKTRVAFDTSSDIRQNALFVLLREFVTGSVEVGALGNPFPFVGPNSGMRLEEGQESRLATMETVSLQGAFAVDIAAGTDGGMLVLLAGIVDEATGMYEVRWYDPDGNVTTFASWMSPLELASTPVAIIQDSDGRVWMGNGEGGMGYVDRNGTPIWLSSGGTGLVGPVESMVADPTDLVWVTDGVTLSVGDEAGFAPVSLLQRMSEGDQTSFSNSVAQFVQTYGAEYPAYAGLGVNEALQPERLSVTRDGEIGVSTVFSAFRFTSSLDQSPAWTDMLSASATVPLVVGPNGDVWGRRLGDDALMRVWATGTRAYTSKLAVPLRARWNGALFTQNASKLYAVDYVPTSTSILWSTGGGDWFSQVIVASGTVSGGVSRKAEVDNDGDVWVLLEEGGLVRIRRSEVVEAL